MGIKCKKPTEIDKNTISFKEALGIIGFRKKDISKKTNEKTSIQNNIKD